METNRNHEDAIVRATINALLEAGYALNVNNGGDDDELPQPTTVFQTIYDAMKASDEDFLIATNDTHRAVVRFVYGNDGYDVINDYSTSLEDVLAPVNALADEMEKKYYH